LKCIVGINKTRSDPFQLTRSIRQRCPLVPFQYLFVADNLVYLLENHEVEGLKLPDSEAYIKDQEFDDDANFYLVGTLENLERAKSALNLFTLDSGSKIKWHKCNAIWMSNSPWPFEWGAEMSLH